MILYCIFYSFRFVLLPFCPYCSYTTIAIWCDIFPPHHYNLAKRGKKEENQKKKKERK